MEQLRDISNVYNASNTMGRVARKGKAVPVRRTPQKAPTTRFGPLPTAKPCRPSKARYPEVGDRFIPVRKNAEAAELAAYLVNADGGEATQRTVRQLCNKLHRIDIAEEKVLGYRKSHVAFKDPWKLSPSQNWSSTRPKSTRIIPTAPTRVLDAPDLTDDYYLNLIDWSASNVLAAGLGSSVYLWNADTKETGLLVELEAHDYVCSVSWMQDRDYLAVGTSTGAVQLWNCSQSKRWRVMNGHSNRVGSLAWNSNVLSSGSRGGRLIQHDVREREHVVSSVRAHASEICGLKWSPDGKMLASGGNDNVVKVWSAASATRHARTRSIAPMHTFDHHRAAVKALAWNPRQPQILASGGGTADGHIRFFNCNSGALLDAVDTKSQVSSLLWSAKYEELVSGHGPDKNQLTIWRYPSLSKVTELTGHSGRVLHMALSPDGNTVVSAGADETLRLWTCFADESKKERVSRRPTPLTAPCYYMR